MTDISPEQIRYLNQRKRHVYIVRTARIFILFGFLFCSVSSFGFFLTDFLLPSCTLFFCHVAEVNDFLGFFAFLVRSLTSIRTNLIENLRINLIEFLLVVET